jgi:osmotically-inducible protein OsmY
MPNFKTYNDGPSRADNSIQSAIADELWKRWEIRAMDISSFSVSVKNGRVLLRGHLTMESNRRLIESICASAPGVAAVDDCLVTDHELTVQVARALAEDTRTRSLVLPVGSYHGWVGIGGQVPDRSLQLAAQEAAACVPTVRGVISLPTVVGQEPLPQKHPVEPQVSSPVYNLDGQVGTVTQVVIDPRNRLVTQIAVTAIDLWDGTPVRGEYLVDAESITLANKESVFLRRDGRRLQSFQPFDPAAYVVAPETWQPPYPYLPGTVLWPAGQAQSAQDAPYTMESRRQAAGTARKEEMVMR